MRMIYMGNGKHTADDYGWDDDCNLQEMIKYCDIFMNESSRRSIRIDELERENQALRQQLEQVK